MTAVRWVMRAIVHSARYWAQVPKDIGDSIAALGGFRAYVRAVLGPSRWGS